VKQECVFNTLAVMIKVALSQSLKVNRWNYSISTQWNLDVNLATVLSHELMFQKTHSHKQLSLLWVALMINL